MFAIIKRGNSAGGRRDIESKDSLKACEYLQESIVIYGDIMDLIDKKRPYIVKAKSRYRKATIFS